MQVLEGQGEVLESHGKVLSRRGTGSSVDFTKTPVGTSLVVQWLQLCPSNAGGTGSIPGQGTKIPHNEMWQKKKRKKERKKKASGFYVMMRWVGETEMGEWGGSWGGDREDGGGARGGI